MNHRHRVVMVMTWLWAVGGAFIVAGQPMESPLTRADLGRELSLDGVLVEKREPRSETAPAVWVLDYGAGRIEMPVFARLLRRLGDHGAGLPEGARVRVTGKVGEHRGTLQLEPSRIEPTGPVSATGPVAAEPGGISPAAVTTALVGQSVTVTGAVASFRPAQGGPWHVLVVEDEGGSIPVAFDNAVAAAVPMAVRHEVVKPGNLVSAGGVVERADRALRIRVINAALLRPVHPPEGMELLPLDTLPQSVGRGEDPGAIGRNRLGQVVTVSGVVASLHPRRTASAPTRVVLRGQGGTINVVWWEDSDTDFLGARAPVVGQPWTVRGQVSEYREGLQIQVRSRRGSR
jgi:DNA/RNA endonuclease YhcR with UshA esterase domain